MWLQIYFLPVGLKGQCHEIFDFRFSTWISFPQAPDDTMRAVSNFFENSRRYSQLKVHHRCQGHRWQMEKIFNQKNFHYFSWTSLNSTVSIQNFFFKFIVRCQQFDNCSHCLPPVSFTPVANSPPVTLIPVASFLKLKIGQNIL
jgi:hypothetical protein